MTALAFNNQRVQQLRRLIGRRSSRHDEGRFVVEGPVLVGEALAAGWTLVEQYVPVGSGTAVDGAGEVVELAAGVFERVGSTEAPQPPIAVVEMPTTTATEVLADASFVVVLDRISDPGISAPSSVPPKRPASRPSCSRPDRSIRTARRSSARRPARCSTSRSSTATLDDVVGAGLDLVGTSSHDAPARTVQRHLDADLTGRTALVMGNEAAGLPDDWNDSVGPIRRWITIPHRGRSESLNVAMAATVLLFEAARQRGQDSENGGY